LQPRRGFRAGTEALLLAAAVPARPGESAFELGCGAGAAILALGARVGGLVLAGLEIQPGYAALARANAALNGMDLELWEGDVADPPRALAGRVFDHVLMNPPFHERARSSRAADPGRDLAHRGVAPLSAWGALAARRLRPGGTLTVVHRATALPDLLGAIPAGLGSVEVLPVAPRAGAAPATILLRARKGGRAPFRLLAPLNLHDGRRFAPAVEAALRAAAPLAWEG
jgi:tRNA1(Val) A37 N6-methylase TrmN6